MESQKVTIFISSTFNDMHAERNYLIEEVFPELIEWAKNCNILLNYIDLRTNITGKEIEKKAVVRTCLKHIDNYHTFFLCFIGQRIGWIPTYENDIDIKTKYVYPSIEKLLDNKSITEIEIEHSVFSPLSQRLNEKEMILHEPKKHNLFFFRKNDYLTELNDEQKIIYTNINEEKYNSYNEKLEIIKSKIRKKAVNEDKNNLKRDDDEKIHIIINEYSAEWNKNHNLIELSNIDNSASMGSLTNFKSKNKPLKEIIINQLKEQILLEFPQITE